MRFWLRIAPRWELALAEHHRGTAAYDVEVTLDGDGLPVFHRSRIHGMLSEAWREHLAGAFEQAYLGASEAATSVVGRLGEHHPEVPAVHDAGLHPDEAYALRDAMEAGNEDRLHRHQVLDALTVVVAGASRDRSAGGAPRHRALLDRRLLRQDVVLWAPVDWPLAAGETAALPRFIFASVVASCRSTGLARNRGFGSVRITIHSDLDGRPEASLQLHQTWLATQPERARQ